MSISRRAKRLQQALHRTAAARRIAIEPCHRGGRKETGHLALYALRPDPDALEERPGAVRTGGRAARRVAAVVAADAAGLAVQRQRHAAVRTIYRPAALAAEHGGRVAAAIQQHEGLLAALQAGRQRRLQRRAQHHLGPVLGDLFPHVDDGDGRQRPLEDALAEHDPFVAPFHGVVMALHGRRRRAQHDQRARLLAAHHRDVAAVVTRALLLLERRVVLLVDDDQAEPVQRREDGGPCAHHHVDVAAPDAVPLVVPLAVGQPAVLDGHAAAAGGAKRAHHGRRQGDLGHEHEHAPALPAHLSRELQVDGGLPAPGHPVQQRDPEPSVRRPRRQAAQRRLLLAGQLDRSRARSRVHPFRRGERVALDLPALDAHQAPAGQPAHGVGGDAVLGQHRDGEPGRGCREQRERAALARAQPRRPTAPGDPLALDREMNAAHGAEPRPGCRARRPGVGRHGGGHRLARAASVVVGDPRGQLQYRRRQERLGVEALQQLPDLDRCAAAVRGRGGQHAAGDLPAPERHADPHARRRQRHAVGNAVGQGAQQRNRNGDRNEAGHQPACRMDRTFFMSSQTSRLRSGLRSRNAGWNVGIRRAPRNS